MAAVFSIVDHSGSLKSSQNFGDFCHVVWSAFRRRSGQKIFGVECVSYTRLLRLIKRRSTSTRVHGILSTFSWTSFRRPLIPNPAFMAMKEVNLQCTIGEVYLPLSCSFISISFDFIAENNMAVSVMDLLAAGLVTTSTTLAWIFLLLALYQETQANLFNEIKKIVGLTRFPSLDDRNE